MKKLTTLILVFILMSLLVIKTTYASETQVGSDISGELTWTKLITNDYHYVRSNRFHIDFTSIEMEFNTTLGSWTEAFVAFAGDYNSVVEVFDTLESTAPVMTYQIIYESPDATETMFLYDHISLGWEVDTTSILDKYMRITLMLNPDPPSGLLSDAQTWLNMYRDQYSFNIYTFRNLLLDQTIADLPVTAGNPDQVGLTGTVWDWNYNAITNTFGAKVQYFSEYNLAIPNVAFDDASFLDRVESIDYYTMGGEKFFQFNFIDNPNVLLTGANQKAQEWNGFALWNLTTNEFVMYNRALALTYIEVTANREIYGYLYLPGIPIDDMLAITGSFNYQYGYKNIFGTQKYTDWEKAVFFLEKDASSSGAQSVFEGALPQWSYDVLAGSIAAMSVGAILTMIPGAQIIGLPLLAVGVAGIVATNVSAVKHLKTGLISEIQVSTVTPQLRNTLNEHYTLASNQFTVLPSNAKIHKLFFGLFTKANTNVVRPDASSLVYSEITWVTKGQVYTLDKRFIDSEAILDQDYENNLPPEGEGGWFEDVFGELADLAKGAAIIILVLVIAPIMDKGSSSISNIFRNKTKLFIVAAIIIFLLIFTGVIRI